MTQVDTNSSLSPSVLVLKRVQVSISRYKVALLSMSALHSSIILFYEFKHLYCHNRRYYTNRNQTQAVHNHIPLPFNNFLTSPSTPPTTANTPLTRSNHLLSTK